jgi:cell division protease FtsH
MSEDTMKAVDKEVRAIIDQQYALARRLLEENRDKVEVMTKALLEWETLDAHQIEDIMNDRPPRPPKPVPAKPVAPTDGPGTRGAEPTSPAPVESA